MRAYYINNSIPRNYGYFRRLPGSSFPFEEGIIITTGIAFNASNPGAGPLNDPSTGLSDSDLSDIVPGSTFTDASVFEFDFVPTSDTISFRYLMMSEEYTQNFPCEFSDSFAFLLRPVGTTDYENIAVIPGTTDTAVSVTNVHPGIDSAGNPLSCPPANPDFFAGYNIGDTNYNGRTTVLTATATVIPNTTYHIKLVIADAGPGGPDNVFDSAVFLEAGSFNLGLDLGDDFVTASNSAVCGDEIPLTANITATNYQWFKDGNPIPGATNQTYTANLGDGVYSCEISNSASCTDQDDIFLEFVEAASINPIISNFQACDADGDLVEMFDLTSKDTEILDGLDPTTFEVQYFSDAAYTTLIVNPATYNNTNPSETIFARVVNRNSTNCTADNSFTIEVTGLPVPIQPIDYEICDDANDGDDTNGFIQSFVLSTKDAEILGTLSPTEYSVSYHLNETDAQSGANPIDKINPYTNVVVNQQSIYYRVQNIINPSCFQSADDDASTIFEPFNLIVSPLPTITALVQLRQCDNDTDGFSDFNLNEAASDISVNFVNETFVFYPSLVDAQNDTNAFTVAEALAYTNQTVTTDTVWARAISTFGCFRIAQVDLIVSTTGLPATFQRSFNECDDFLDIDGNDTVNNDDTDGVSTFDFSSVTQEVINLFPVSQQLTVTYYRNQADALAEANAITDPSNYRNIAYPNTQQIYIRVDSNLDNDCLGFGPFITLTVDPVPVANTVGVENLELCDNGDDGIFDNGIVQTFNLDQQTPLILGTQSASDYTVTYHTSATDALDGFNAITTTGVYENITANQQTIYVRVTNNTTGCFTNHTSFDLIVNPLPVANFVDDLEICDTINLPIDGSAQNGFSTQIDLELQTPIILGTQDPGFIVTYHASLDDAQAGDFPLSSPFTNSVAFSQTIYVRVFNPDTECANGISNFNVIVNPEPMTGNVSNLSYCDDDLDGDDTNGFVQNINLDSQILGILDFDNTGQDEDDFTVTFHETLFDAQDGMNPITSPYANSEPNQKRIYVRVVNNDTGCINDDAFFDVIVNPLPTFRVTSPQIVCLNGPPLVLTVEDPAAVYDYVWTDPVGNMVVGSQLTVTSGGLYTVTASTVDGTTDENDVACSRTREIQVDESIIATIREQNISITDDLIDGTDQSNFSISIIDPTDLGIGDYEYALTNENGLLIRTYQDDTTFENIEGGFYTLFVRDKNGCGVAELDISVVQFPKFFTPNNDGRNDTWAIKGANSSFFPSSQVHIFNRFGKVVAKINIDNPGWNGTFNGKTLPSDDYWFSIQLTHRDGRVIDMQGNLSLVRRE